MDLNEAALVFQQMILECPSLAGMNFLIMIPEPTFPAISKGYEIIIRKNHRVVDQKTDRVLHEIVLERGLKILEAENTIAIYTPNE